MPFNPTQIQALNDPGLGAAASLIGSGLGAVSGILENKITNRNLLARQLLEGQAALEKSKLDNAAELAKTKLTAPSKLANEAKAFYELAKLAEDSGNYAEAERYRKLGETYGGQAVGGIAGGGIGNIDIGGTSSALGNLGGTGGLTPSSPAGLQTTQQTTSATTPATPGGFGGSTSTPLAPTSSISGQKGFSEAIKAGKEASQANVIGSLIKSYDSTLSAPEGSDLTGIANTKFDGIKLDKAVKTTLELAKQRYAINPAKANEEAATNRRQSKDIMGLLDLIDEMERGVSKNVFEQTKKSILQKGGKGITSDEPLPFDMLTLAKGTGLISKKDEQAFAAAKAARNTIKSQLTAIGRRFNDETGNLSNTDVSRAEGLLPDFNSDPTIFEAQKRAFAKALLPKLLEGSLAVGDAIAFNEAQKKYTKIFGKKWAPSGTPEGQWFEGIAQPSQTSQPASSTAASTPATTPTNKPAYNKNDVLKKLKNLGI